MHIKQDELGTIKQEWAKLQFNRKIFIIVAPIVVIATIVNLLLHFI